VHEEVDLCLTVHVKGNLVEARGSVVRRHGVLTVFLTMSFTIALRVFLDLPKKEWYHSDVGGHRVLGFFIGMASLFLLLLAALSIPNPTHFFGWSTLAILLDFVWICNQREMIDPVKDRGPLLCPPHCGSAGALRRSMPRCATGQRVLG
jgi:hypothetical protein